MKPETKSSKIRQRHSQQYKTESLALAEKVGVPTAARQLGLHESQLYSWRSKSDAGSAERAAQIDMVIERGDNTINLCEMKFSESEFAINKDYEKILRNKIVRFREETKTRKSIQLTFISSYGLQRNMYSGIAQNEVVLNDLF